MNAICAGIVALTCSCLFLASVSSFAQTHNKTTAAFPNSAATASYRKLAALWRQQLGLPASPAQANVQERAPAAPSDDAGIVSD
ncbi:MAG: hypothetical protein ACRD2O_04435, partial [Terriglobia bacterium]